MILKEAFCKQLNEIQKDCEAVDRVNQILFERKKRDFFDAYSLFEDRINSTFKILGLSMHCEDCKEAIEWIEWFAFETDFGANNYTIEICSEKTNNQKEVIEIRTPEILYDFIIRFC